jgi:hypothetical protein
MLKIVFGVVFLQSLGRKDAKKYEIEVVTSTSGMTSDFLANLKELGR